MNQAIEKLLEWTPRYVDLEEVARINDVEDFNDEDKKAPFFSEAYLYNLVGKEDARTLLALMRKALESVGIAGAL